MVLGGDPGRMPSELTLENWQSASQLHWTFQHIADFLPTAVISRGTGPVSHLASTYTTLSGVPVENSRIMTNRRSSGDTSYCCRFLASRYPDREKSGRGVPATNVGPRVIGTAIIWVPFLKNSSRPLWAQRGSVPPWRETSWNEVAPGNGVT